MNRFFTLLLAASCLTAVGQVPDYVPTEGLVAWYPFTGDAADFSGNGHHGTVDGAGSAPDRNGLLDQSLFFDGVNDGVFIPHHDDFLTADQTVTLWINIAASELNDTPGAKNSMGLVNKTNQESSNTENRFFAINLGGVGEPSYEPYQVTLAASTGQSVNPGSSVESASTDTMIYSNHWFFIAATMTENSLEIYVDGELVASSVLLYSRYTNTADIKIGVDYKFDPNRYFNGRLDDVGFWNRALSSEEILGLYLAATPVMGCMDPEACNFDDEAVVDDGSCISCDFIATFCGVGTIWDSASQTCIVANPSDSNFDGCVQLNDLLDVLSAYGDCGAGESPWQCGEPLEYQGYDYDTVQIGEQCWFAENLRAENYSNGDSVLSSLTDSGWASTNEGAAVVYGESETCVNHSPVIDACDPTESLVEYGRLYNGYAIIDSRGLCPSEWGIPTDAQWQSIISLVGGASVAGGALKANFGWNSGGNGNDSFGFGGEPGGDRNVNGECVEAGRDGDWWTSTLTGNTILAWEMYHNNSTINQLNGPLNSGFSVRCIKDAE